MTQKVIMLYYNVKVCIFLKKCHFQVISKKIKVFQAMKLLVTLFSMCF
jgi:hypothetical protein